MKTSDQLDTNSRSIQSLRDQHYNATLTEFRRLHDQLAILRVRPDEPLRSFAAGQYTVLGLGTWEHRVKGAQIEEPDDTRNHRLIRRAYSISCSLLNFEGRISTTSSNRDIEFYVALVMRNEDHAPGLTPRLFMLERGDRLYVGDHCHGRYTLERVLPDQQVVFISTGTGEAPHNAMLAELFARNHQARVASVVCTRHRADLGYLETHRKLERIFPCYRYLPLTTREPENTDPTHPNFVGRRYVQDYFLTGDMELHAEFEFQPQTTHVFLCGNPAMIRGISGSNKDARRGMIELLEQRGFSIDRAGKPGNLHFEKYW